MAGIKRNKKRKLEDVEEDVVMEEVDSSSDSSSEEQEQESAEEEEEKADSSESEEESTEAAQQDSSDGSESEEEGAPAEENEQQDDRSSDTSESEEENAPVEEAEEDSSDSSESEENTPAVEIKQEVDSNSSSDTSDNEEESAAVEDAQQSESESEESEEESVPGIQVESSDNEEVQKKPRVPVKVEMPSSEPKKKKVKTKEELEEELGDDEIRLRAVRRLLGAIPRNNLTKIVADATAQYDELYSRLKTAAESCVALRKVFVRDLAVETRTKKLKAYFKSFGKIEDGAVFYDKLGKSRRFGFITFTEVEAAVRATAKKSIIIDGRKVSCNFEFIKHDAPQGKAPRGSSVPQKSQQEKQALYTQIYEETKGRKLYVAGLRQHTREEALREEFKKFGKLENVVVVLDRTTRKSKGCAFITYREKAGADAALKTPPKKIDGHIISCSIASLGKKNNKKHGGKSTH